MSAVVSVILDEWVTLSLWLAGLFAGFSLLARWTPCNPGQTLWREGLGTDLVYAFVIPVLNRFMRVVFIAIGIYFLLGNPQGDSLERYIKEGYGPLSELPLWLQAAVMFLLSDIMLYWIHRLFHRKTLWPFHAIHHSSPQVDWLSTYRFHPVNTWLSFVLVDATMMLIGFSPAAVAVLAAFNILYSAMVHANLNWTFGPFRHVFASPVFHRWHHTAQEEGMDKNFAPTFPLLDVLFGTFYMPEGRVPERYGVKGSDIPSGFLGQMIWPFRQAKP